MRRNRTRVVGVASADERLRRLALILSGFAAAVLVAALPPAGKPAGIPSRDVWASLRRPLRLAPLATEAACPVSLPHTVDRGRIGGAVGTGPIYPLPSSFSEDGRHAGLVGAKTIWTWPATLRTHPVRVLVRGIRLDQPDAMLFLREPGCYGLQLDYERGTAILVLNGSH